MKIWISLLSLVVVLGSCSKKKDQYQIDNDAITKYISDHHLDAKSNSDGLYYVITTPGSGITPTPTSNVTVAYTGYLTDGTIFDQSSSKGVTFNLSNVIKGWTEGIPYFKKGGSGKLLIPSALGYGSSAQQGIPANSVLIFDIQLLDVK